MPYIEAKLFGPWSKFKKLMDDLPVNLKKSAISSQRKIAEKYVRKIKAHLRKQDIPGWTPLKPSYADYKMGKYGHEDILIASRTYYESIKSWRKDGIYHAGVPKDIKYDNGISVAKVGFIHEKWSKMSDKPHRPLWDYTINNDMGGRLGIQKMVFKEVNKKLKSKGY